jgi:hypothetical protein
MLKHFMNTRALRMAGFAIAIGLVTAVVSVPVGAAKDQALSKSELKNLVANAEKTADHERVALYFDAEAAKYEAEAKDHGELSLLYQRNTPTTPTKYPGSMQTFNHCDSLSKSLQGAAANARQLAADHREMAKSTAR